MARTEPLVETRSLHGALRDLFPIYDWGTAVVLAVSFSVLYLISWGIGRNTTLPGSILLTLLIGYVVLRPFRPMVLDLTESQADALERRLERQGHYVSGGDGIWRYGKGRWSNARIEVARSGSGGAEVVTSGDTAVRIKSWLNGTAPDSITL